MSRKASAHTVYLRDLVAWMWRYYDQSRPKQPSNWFDKDTQQRNPLTPTKKYEDRPPVYKNIPKYEDHNVLVNPRAPSAHQQKVKALLPPRSRHRFFGSMKSSQALAQSVFGNLHLLGRLDVLDGLKDRGYEVFDTGLQEFRLERSVDWLGEIAGRSTEMDVSMWSEDEYTVAVECKLAEPDVGRCSRATKRKPSEPEYCNGRYAKQAGHTNPCPLSDEGIEYWTHVPHLFHWPDASSEDLCPLMLTYQLVRNVLAACVRPDKTVSPDYGHAVLVYDVRNPRFTPGAGGLGDLAFQEVIAGLRDPSRLRRVSWQQIAHRLRGDQDLRWLGEALWEKYGI